jgi:tRNA/rRNA methyltransferase
MNRPRIKVILVRPRNPDNIGAAARAMANFGLEDLALAGAFDSDWAEAAACWRKEASVSAIGAMDIIEKTELHPDVRSAAAGCAALFGTSSLHRLKPDRDVIALRDAPAAFARCGGTVGVLFGAEKTGLTKEDLSFCSAILNIPTLDQQPSMNLGQAVAVAAYEFSGRRAAAPAAGRLPAPLMPPAELDRLAERIRAKLEREAGAHWGGAAQVRAIRRGLTDARLTKDAMSALKLLLKD